MERVYTEVKTLERIAKEKIGLTEDLMIENAAAALEKEVLPAFTAFVRRSGNCAAGLKAAVLCGGGNNGADGYALARRLPREVPAIVCALKEPHSSQCIKQAEMARNAGVKIYAQNAIEAIDGCAVIVDCIYGTGFHGILDENIRKILAAANSAEAFRIACDVPSGIDENGVIASTDPLGQPVAFAADVTVTMCARKTALYSDAAKSFCGRIICASIGLPLKALAEEHQSGIYVVGKSDIQLPFRKDKSVHKGIFGHSAVVMGEKPGAAVIAGTAALNFGAGLVTLTDICPDRKIHTAVPPELMYSDMLPENTSAVLIGSGLGRSGAVMEKALGAVLNWLEVYPCGGIVIDADMFYYSGISEFLHSAAEKYPEARIVLTPHPKEFQSLMNLCGMNNVSIKEIADGRIGFLKAFSARFPHCVLVLKGANTVIESAGSFYISTEGCQCLSKAGTGDVLAGLLCALLAQGRSAEDSAVTAVFAHGTASRKFAESYSLTPFKLIQAVAELSR